MGYIQSIYQPAVYHHSEKDVLVVVHVDDFLCTGDGEDLKTLFNDLSKEFQLKQTTLSFTDSQEATYLNRTLRWDEDGIKISGDPKHAEILLKEWGLQDCKEVNTPMLKELEENLGGGEELQGEAATKVRRGIARLNYMAQDRPDLSAAAKSLSQFMSKPHEGTLLGLKRCIRYVKAYPVGTLLVPRGHRADDQLLSVFSDSDWAGDIASRRSTSGGFVRYRGTVLMHWSKVQANVALSSAEAELNATVKGLSELVGFYHLICEVLKVMPALSLCTDASACKGMLLRHGAGKVKHLSVKQLWSQEVVRTFEIQICKIARRDNPSDVLTHCVSHPEAERQLQEFNQVRGKLP